MGRKKRKQPDKAQAPARRSGAAAPTRTATTGRPSRRWRAVGLGAVGVVGIAAAGWWLVALGMVRLPGARAEFPKPRAVAPARGPTLEDFAGAESCKECHEAEYAAWRVSTHGRAGGTPSRDLVIARFDGTPIRFADAVVTPVVNAEGRYQFIVDVSGRRRQIFAVDGVIGGGHMVGGGTQGFISRFPDGTIRFLPFDFIKREAVWFCNTSTRTERGWVPITPQMSLAECGDWPPIRILGTDTRYGNCQECHVARIELGFDSSANRVSTRVPSLAIDCESCHGPLAEHVKRADPASIAREGDLRVEALATRSRDGSLEVCFRCHAVKDVMRPGYLPGAPLLQYYSLSFPLLGSGPLFPDGRIRTFAYQENHRFSDCYLNGSMTCVDCHDPHLQGYRDIRGRVLDSRFSDEQCTDCHASKRDRPQDHTHHWPGAAGSRCVDCHMPYLQQPELGYALRFARSDHTIAIPRPGSDDRMGVVNACALSGCHQGMSTPALEARVKQWYGDLKPRKPIVAALLDTDGLRDMRGGTVLLDSVAAHPAAQVMAVGAFVSRFLTPDMPALDSAADRALWALARSPDVDLRSVALAALHLARGEDPGTRSSLVRVLEEAKEDDTVLRTRWATALGTFGDQYLEAEQWDRAIRAYQKALEIRPGNAALTVNLGVAQASKGDYRAAAGTQRRAIVLDARLPLAWINLGFSLERLGDVAGAEDAYRGAIAVNPNEPLAHFNLGNQFLRARRLGPAIEQYEQAVELQPTLVQAYEYLVQAYVASGDVERALATARRWRRFAPQDQRLPQLVMELERAPRRPANQN